MIAEVSRVKPRTVIRLFLLIFGLLLLCQRARSQELLTMPEVESFGIQEPLVLSQVSQGDCDALDSHLIFFNGGAFHLPLKASSFGAYSRM